MSEKPQAARRLINAAMAPPVRPPQNSIPLIDDEESDDDDDDDDDDDNESLEASDIPTQATDISDVTQTPESFRLKKKRTWIWKHIFKLKKPATNRGGKLCSFVCKLCQEDPLTEFEDCLVCIHQENPSNGHTHIRINHPNKYIEETKKNNKGKRKAGRQQSILPSLSNDAVAAGQNNDTMDSYLAKGNEAVIGRVHALIGRLVVNRRLPLSLAIDKDLNEIITTASYLVPNSYQTMTRAKMDAVLLRMFANFVSTVSKEVATSRAMYAPSKACLANRDPESDNPIHPGWMVVCHDGWDSSVKTFFGVSGYWINLTTWKLHKVALGLATPSSHDAQSCKEAALDVLARYGITKEDIFLSINDTASAAVATGRLLSGENGNCHMHMANLVADHASGKLTRSANRQVVDSFPECEAIRLKARQMIQFIFGKKSKSRSEKYKARNAVVGQKTLRLGVDNDTRIAGVERMYQQLLRCRYCIPTYFNEEEPEIRDKYMLTEAEWKLLSQIEAVMRSTCKLSFVTQEDSRPTAGVSWLNVAEAKLELILPTYAVVDVRFAGDEKRKWDAKTTFDKLPTVEVKSNDLEPTASKLLKRLGTETDKYFPTPDDHECVAMMCDPVMLTTGLTFLSVAGFASTVVRSKQLFKAALLEEAKRSNNSIQAVAQKKDAVAKVGSTSSNKKAKHGVFQKVMASHAATIAQQVPQEPEAPNYQKMADNAYDNWMKVEVDWVDFLKIDQKVPAGDFDEEAVKANNCSYLSEQVDILLWWRLHSVNHRLVARVAGIELARPSSNGLQERVFSFCKLVDTPLRQNLSNEKFEMLSILAFNRQFVSSEVGSSTNLNQLIDSLHSAASASIAAQQLVKFFQLDEEKGNDEGAERDDDENEGIFIMLKHAASEAAASNPKPSKRARGGPKNG